MLFYFSEQQPNGSSVLIHHRKSHSLDTNNGVSVDIKPQDRKLKQNSRAQQNMWVKYKVILYNKYNYENKVQI